MTEQALKKEWTEPELIVLVRNKPEEAVLEFCKTASWAPSPDVVFSNCQAEPGCTNLCNLIGSS